MLPQHFSFAASCSESGDEVLRRPEGGVARGKEYAPGFEQRQCRLRQFPEVFVHSKSAKFFGVRERGRIEQDKIKFAALFLKSAQPVKDVAKDEVMKRGVQVIFFEVIFPPLEVFFRKVQAGGVAG